MTATVTDTVAGNAQDSKVNGVEDTTGPERHFRDWPNESGFNARVEHHEPVELRVQGTFPSYVAGNLMRIGPGAFKFPRKDPKDGVFAASHWFDGFTHVHKFNITPEPTGNSRITYTSRMQADKLLEQARATGNLANITFGQKRDPCDSFFKKLKTVWEPTVRNAPGDYNIGVSFQPPVHASAKDGLKGKDRQMLTATSDQSTTLEFDLETLEPFGVTDQTKLHPSLDGQLSAAHPSIDPTTGDVFNYNLKLGPTSTYRMFRVNASNGSTDILATFTGADPAYIHSQFLTSSFHILCVWPAKMAMGGAKILWERNILSAMEKFNPTATTEWVVVDRHHGQGVVARFTSSAFFAFHTVNAWETTRSDGKVDLQCELVTHPNLDVLHHFYYEQLVSNGPKACSLRTASELALTRYCLSGVALPEGKDSSKASKKTINISKLPAGKAEVTSRVGSAAAGELPTLNPAYALQPHRYVYGVSDHGLSTFMDSLVKTDTVTGQSTEWSERAHTPGEAIFVVDPQGAAEDDGVLLSVILDGTRGSSYLLCLNAKDMKELGRAEVGCAVGLGFHGCFLDAPQSKLA